MDRPNCIICGKLSAKHSSYKGKQYWRNLCVACKSQRDRDSAKHRGKKNYPGTLGGRVAIKYNLDLTCCELCGWRGFCDVHHKDRDRNNNQRENLQIICPNCHRNIHHFLCLKTTPTLK